MTASKNLADFTTQDRVFSRRYEQGQIHARQGRTDLLGLCPAYDAGFEAEDLMIGEAALDAITFTPITA